MLEVSMFRRQRTISPVAGSACGVRMGFAHNMPKRPPTTHRLHIVASISRDERKWCPSEHDD